MPRGYLKKSKDVSRKQARGGSSRSKKPWWQRNGGEIYKDYNTYWKKTENISSALDDVPVDPIKNVPRRKFENPPKLNYQVSECAICFEEAPLICLSDRCKWHGAACFKCLRTVHVKNAQKSSKNYPIVCFHPLCKQNIQFGQLEKHGLLATPEEAKKHHEMVVLHKIETNPEMRTVHCPICQFPRGVSKFDKDRKYGCTNCKKSYIVSPDYATICALEKIGVDGFGCNDGWAKCPNCKILISKGDGCDHMTCIYCDHEFSWEDAQNSFGRLARPPDEEIYLWW
mmetsp:Transcript_19797/g.41620  ORF Transcript_19797/g.41620 Transcript_19797/m.41620 type:complete len:284 (-) Transcript_19797:172-1023(-)